jgi:hypothetical protein
MYGKKMTDPPESGAHKRKFYYEVTKVKERLSRYPTLKSAVISL